MQEEHCLLLWVSAFIAFQLGSHVKAKEYTLKALLCTRHLTSAYPGTPLEWTLAHYWTQLVLHDRSVMPADEALGYLDEALCIYRRLCRYDPTKFNSKLIDCLNHKAYILGDLGRAEEARKCLLEVLDLDTQGVTDQTDVAQSLFNTSTYLSNFRWKGQAIVLRIRTVEIYRMIQKKPNKYEDDLFLDLAFDYKSENKIDAAITAADAAFRQFLASPLSLLPSTLFNWERPSLHGSTFSFHRILPKHTKSSIDVAVPVSWERVERLRGLAQVHPEVVGMAFLERSEYHGHLLAHFDRLKEAVNWLERLGANYHDLASTNVEIGEWYISLRIDLAGILKDQGDMKQAIMVLTRAAESGRTQLDIDPFLTYIAKSEEADIVGCLGDSITGHPNFGVMSFRYKRFRASIAGCRASCRGSQTSRNSEPKRGIYLHKVQELLRPYSLDIRIHPNFSGNREDALKLLEEAKGIWGARVEIRKFDLRNLALTLWALGFAYCLLRRHEDGASAHQELKKMINGLKYAEPTMHQVVTVALDQERRRPSWVHFLENVREELQCGHLI
ncbi:hypothetical protein CPB83DRAFT_841213 [Crepidotus variabilis]|uniref:Uncharacterized protein n=1 Tax=Crepidotus variabilis TaxID=179855 RepID=A0A9P6E2V5_9AGAR|nr:hypothetical protein CPB83DRAFT_841213 [Crepidotus variabilis]